ncbi:MAG: hypothetical protein HYY05_06235 [Chloroflexi bacterium]|nr:hypothetical protein [Chloroflexota bacterium]
MSVFRHLGPPLLIVALSSFALLPLAQGDRFPTHDGDWHLIATIEFDRVLRSGVPYPRWAPDFAMGYGHPRSSFYPPLAYYLSEALHLVGFGFLTAQKLNFALGLLLSGPAMYLLARAATGSRLAGTVAGLAYVYLPYHLHDVYVRGALGESLALPFLPLVLWSIHRVLARPAPARVALAGLSYGGLLLSHHVTALFFTPLLGAYGAVVLWASGRQKGAERAGWARLLAPLAGLALGATLAAVSWLPILPEAKDTTVRWFGYFNPAPEALRLSDVLARYLTVAYDYANEPPFVGVVQAAAAAGGVALFLWTGANGLRRRRAFDVALIATLGGLTLGYLLLMTPWADGFWEHTPLVGYAQFRWRVFAFVGVATALFTGYGAVAASPVRWLYALVAPLAIGWASMASLSLDYRPLDEATLDAGFATRYAIVGARSGRLREYEALPIWTQAAFPQPRENLRIEVPEPAGTLGEIVPDRWDPYAMDLSLSATEATTLTFHGFYFPGWQAYVNGSPALASPSPEGLLSVAVPQGRSYLAVRFEDTPIRAAGARLTLGAAALVAVLALWPARRPRPPSRWPVWAVAAILAVTAGALAWPRGADAPTGTPGIQPLGVRLGDSLHLIGLEPPRRDSRGTVRFTLFWQALAHKGEDLLLRTEIRDAAGQLLAHEEAKPFYWASPTSTWSRHELVRDPHEVFLVPSSSGPARVTVSVIRGAEELATADLGPVFDDEDGATPIASFPGLDFAGRFSLQRAGLALMAPERHEAGRVWRDLPLVVADPGREIGARFVLTLGPWRASAYSLYLHLVDRQGRMWAQADQPLAIEGVHAADHWLEGQQVLVPLRLGVPADLPPGLYKVLTGAYVWPTLEPLHPSGGQSPEALAGYVRVRSSVPRDPLPAPAAGSAEWRSGVRLRGALIESTQVTAGEEVRALLAWDVGGRLAADLTVFLHLAGPDGRPVAQHDSQPDDGNLPTSLWEPGEEVREVRRLTVPPGTPRGDYRVLVGLYSADTGERVALAAGGDSLILATVRVEP